MHLEYFKKEILPLKDKLFRFARSYIRDKDMAEDVVQEVFIKLWRKKEDFKKIKNIEAWSMTMTKNLVFDKLKADRYQSLDVSHINEDPDPARLPDAILEQEETIRDIRNLIDSLPEKQREVLILRDIEGYSYKEMGEILGLDPNLVKVTLFRARENMRKKILKTERYGL